MSKADCIIDQKKYHTIISSTDNSQQGQLYVIGGNNWMKEQYPTPQWQTAVMGYISDNRPA